MFAHLHQVHQHAMQDTNVVATALSNAVDHPMDREYSPRYCHIQNQVLIWILGYPFSRHKVAVQENAGADILYQFFLVHNHAV